MKSVCMGIGMVMGGVGSDYRHSHSHSQSQSQNQGQAWAFADEQVRSSTCALANTVLNPNHNQHQHQHLHQHQNQGCTEIPATTACKRTFSCHNVVNANMNALDQRESAPIIKAILSGNIDLVDQLLAQRAQVARGESTGS